MINTIRELWIPRISRIARIFLLIACCQLLISSLYAQPNVKLKKKDRKRDIALVTTEGTIVLRLHDSTPVHRDNFLKLAKGGYYDQVMFHRVIQNFMVQGGDLKTRPGHESDTAGLNYTLLPEFRKTLFHRKGVLAAARMPDNVNPQKQSSGTQFYIVQGRIFTDAGLDSVETYRLKGRKLPAEHREIYKTIGGTPHLDQDYTIFGEVVGGLDVVDKIAAVRTNKPVNDRPVADVKIIEAKLVKRKRNN